MAEEESTEKIRLQFPTGRIKKIMKLDRDINKVTSEALFVVSSATELFLRSLTEKSAQVAVEKKRKVVKLDHLRIAVKRHQPTSDFLIDSLPVPNQTSEKPSTEKSRVRPLPEKPIPAGTRRIDQFFSKSTTEASIETNDS